MKQKEVDNISKEFLQAWKDFFGMKLKYIPYNREDSDFSDIYGDNIPGLAYDYNKAIEIYGIIKELDGVDKIMPAGKRTINYYEITIVTYDLFTQGITKVDTNDRITFIDKFGEEHILELYETYKKVQFSNDKIFTKIKAREIE